MEDRLFLEALPTPFKGLIIMQLIRRLVRRAAPDHRAVFQDFASGLARMLHRRQARARVRAV